MRLRPVALVVTFALGLLAGPLPVEAQQAGKVYRIGWLGPTGPVTREAGAVRVVPGSHRRFFGEWRKSIHVDLEASGALGEADLDRAVALEARPGQFYLFHSWILHGSPPNGSSEPRVDLNMRFAGRGDEVDPGFEYVPLSGDVSDGGGDAR